jgi:hypothetical protein
VAVVKYFIVDVDIIYIRRHLRSLVSSARHLGSRNPTINYVLCSQILMLYISLVAIVQAEFEERSHRGSAPETTTSRCGPSVRSFGYLVPMVSSSCSLQCVIDPDDQSGGIVVLSSNSCSQPTSKVGRFFSPPTSRFRPLRTQPYHRKKSALHTRGMSNDPSPVP